jgi:MerR family transcriptional regulator, copper efflux regulator
MSNPCATEPIEVSYAASAKESLCEKFSLLRTEAVVANGISPAKADQVKLSLTLDHAPGCRYRKGAKAMQIGVVAKRTGLSVEAIRFYERSALLPRATRTPGGFRKYGETDVETLAFIRRVQRLGFTLKEIRDLSGLRGSRLQPCAPVRCRLEEKLSDVQRKLTDLQKLQQELRLALRSCDRELRKRGAHCPILRSGNPRKADSAN